MNITDIKFPVYQIGAHEKLFEKDGVIYISTIANNEKIIDNKNLKGDSLAKRRLQIKYEKRYRFPKAYHTFGALLKNYKNPLIDSNGNIFKYVKTRRRKLTYEEIDRVSYIDGKGVLLYIKGLDPVFLVSNSVYNGERYVGLLHINGGLFLYELSHTKKKNTWRKI